MSAARRGQSVADKDRKLMALATANSRYCGQCTVAAGFFSLRLPEEYE